jgi:hypothetical protein
VELQIPKNLSGKELKLFKELEALRKNRNPIAARLSPGQCPNQTVAKFTFTKLS